MEFTPSVLLSFLHTNFRFVKLNLLFPAIIMMILSLLCHKNVHFGFKWSPKIWPEAKLFWSKQSQLHKSHFQNNWRKIPTKTFNVGQLVHLFTHHCCKILRCCWESFVRKKLGRCPNFLGFLFSENCFWNCQVLQLEVITVGAECLQRWENELLQPTEGCKHPQIQANPQRDKNYNAKKWPGSCEDI